MIKFEIKGDDAVIAKLFQFPESLRSQLRKAVQESVFNLQAHVKANKLSGQVLKNRTGRLRRSISQSVTDTGTAVVGIVGTNVKYARAQEYGFKGIVTVREHLRQLRTAHRMALVGASKHGGIGEYVKKRGKLTGEVATVKEHSRKVDLPARSFLRSALKDVTPEFMQTIQQAVNDACKRNGG